MSHGPATLVVVALLATVALAPSGAAVATNEVSMSGFTADPGEIGLVLVSAQATNVSAYEANVTFDPDVVTVVAAGRQDFPNPEETIDREQGWVRLSAERNEGVDDPILTSLVVRVLSGAEPGTETELSFVESDTTLTDATDGELTIDGYGSATVNVVEPDTPTPTPTPESTPNLSVTATPTVTPSPTPAVTPTVSPTPTATPTATPTPTETPTSAQTDTPTETTTPTQTTVSSPTPTATEAPVTTTAPATATPTASPEPTPTDRAPTTTTGEGPGFGAVVTLLVVLVATGLVCRTRDR